MALTPDQLRDAALELGAAERTALLSLLLDRYGEERVKEAVQSLPSADMTKVFRASVRGILGDPPESAEQRLEAALGALDEGHAARMHAALANESPARLLFTAANVLKGKASPDHRQLGYETEDVLKRLGALMATKETW